MGSVVCISGVVVDSMHVFSVIVDIAVCENGVSVVFVQPVNNIVISTVNSVRIGIISSILQI